MTIEQLIQEEEAARNAVFSHIKRLRGTDRKQAVREALQAGYSPTDLAKGLGISRGRLYQLKEGNNK